MTDTVLIPFGGAWLALTPEQFQAAVARAAELVPAAKAEQGAPAAAEILDAEGMEARTGVPASWWLEQARKGTVPHIRAGKYVRFELGTVLAALESGNSVAQKIGNISQPYTAAQAVYRKKQTIKQ
jgi:hypothetical protein